MTPAAAPAIVIGGGLAGLTAATYLRRHGVPVRLFEAGKALAGLSRTERDEEGFTYDFGAHFITNRLAAAVGVSASCRDMLRYGESVRLRGRTYGYPFGLMGHARYAASALASRASAPFQPSPTTAEEWYRARYGRALADEVALPLTEAWSGVPAGSLAASVGEKFATSLARTILLRASGGVTGRTVAIGYSSTLRESPHVWHVYPNGGIGTICDKLAAEVPDVISLETPVEAIYVENEKVVGVRAGGEDVPASAAISTAPVHALAKLVRGTDRLAHLARFKYRAMAFVNLKLDGPSGLPDVVTWTPEPEYPFFRLSDIGAGLPWLVPQGKAMVTCDIGCQVGDESWTAADDALASRCAEGLERIVPGAARRVIGHRVMRTPLAYPVYHVDYEDDRRRLEIGTGVEGLFSIGRNGEFTHSLMEDVYWRSRRKLRPLIDGRV